MNFDKTEFMVFHKNKDNSIKNEEIQRISLNGNVINRVFVFKYLGLWFEPTMGFNKHYEIISKKVSQRLKYLAGIKRFMSVNVMK